MLKGKCATCETIKTRFVQKGGDIVDSLNRITHRVKLPWARFRGEMHLPGHKFTGPGTKLKKRLNPDGTPKSWSKMFDRVDRAAYHHDLAYAKYADKAKRLEADKRMICELDDIENPTVHERTESDPSSFLKRISESNIRQRVLRTLSFRQGQSYDERHV